MKTVIDNNFRKGLHEFI